MSDTHGLLRPEVLEAFWDVTGIIHVGDVGRPEILESLQELAPIIAVRGNVDTGAWADQLPLSAIVKIGNIRAYIYHGHEAPKLEPAEAHCQVVVSGHSHTPNNETRDGVLYLNPGSAGPSRFKLPVTVMRLYITRSDISAELVHLI